MKKNTLLLLALAGGALILLSMKKKDETKKRAYTLTVEDPTAITAEEFGEVKEAPGLLEKLGPVIKNVIKKGKERRAAKKKIGFPDLY